MGQYLHHKARVWELALPAQGVGAALVVAGAAQEGQQSVKVKFPLKISDRAWWLEVQVLKSHGNKSRRKNDKGPQDMDVDCIKNVTADLSPKTCQSKDVVTKVALPAGQLTSTSTSETQVQT